MKIYVVNEVDFHKRLPDNDPDEYHKMRFESLYETKDSCSIVIIRVPLHKAVIRGATCYDMRNKVTHSPDLALYQSLKVRIVYTFVNSVWYRIHKGKYEVLF